MYLNFPYYQDRINEETVALDDAAAVIPAEAQDGHRGDGGRLSTVMRVGKAIGKSFIILNAIVLSCGAVLAIVLLVCMLCAGPARTIPIY